jgi:steroid delta-isomerase-like uncharacterized protein
MEDYGASRDAGPQPKHAGQDRVPWTRKEVERDMNEQDRIAIAKREMDYFNAGDWIGYTEVHTTDAVYDEAATGRCALGMDETLAILKAWREAYPDLKSTITNIVADGETVVVELIWTGTHTGPLAGPFGVIPPTGKRGMIRAVEVFVFSGDKIKETRHYFDVLSMLAQIGALPAPIKATA